MKSARTNLPLLLFVLVAAAGLFAIGWQHIRIDTDIVSSLPQDDPVIRDAMHIFKNHPFQDQLTIDVGLDNDDPDLLVAVRSGGGGGPAKQRVVQEAWAWRDMAKGLPQMMRTVVDSLPVLFTARELEERVRPLLAPENDRPPDASDATGAAPNGRHRSGRRHGPGPIGPQGYCPGQADPYGPYPVGEDI